MQPHLCHTTEVRWFLPGGQNDTAWLTWFLADNTLPLLQEEEPPPGNTLFALAEASRLDRYMIVPENGQFSIKQRQGNLEVKVQLPASEPFRQDEISGSANQWMKWSFAPRDEALKTAFTGDLQLSASWIDVEKHRYLIEAGWEQEKGLTPPTDSCEPSCQFELTQLNLPTAAAGPHPWLTFAIELTVCADQPPVSLADVCRSFVGLRGLPPSPLTLSDSHSYPSWLAARLSASAPTS